MSKSTEGVCLAQIGIILVRPEELKLDGSVGCKREKGVLPEL